MTTPRLLQIRTAALAAQRQMKKKGWVRRNNLPRITLEEDKWLGEHKPNIKRFTRLFEYQYNEFVQDVDRPSEARRPMIREFWVGARSQSLASGAFDTEVEEATGEDLPAGFRKSQGDQEESAEMTELMTLTYDDPEGFEQWLKVEQAHRYQELTTLKPRLRKHRVKLLKIIEQVIRKEHPLPLMIEDEWGHRRPICPGDVITVARGSNDDLDALFLEEADDPREQNDFTADGSDHRYSDRFRANTEMEESFLHDRTRVVPNSALPEGTRYNPDDLQLRRMAQERACDLVLRDPSLSNSILKLADEIEANLRRGVADVRFDHEGILVAGYFANRSEYFASVEAPFLKRRPKVQQPCTLHLQSGTTGETRKVAGFKSAKLAPLPTDWSQVRGC